MAEKKTTKKAAAPKADEAKKATAKKAAAPKKAPAKKTVKAAFAILTGIVLITCIYFVYRLILDTIPPNILPMHLYRFPAIW